MQIELPDQVVDALREALTPVIDRLIDERVEQRRPLLLSVAQVADELSCTRSSVYGLIRGGHLEAIRMGRTYRVATVTLQLYVEELAKPTNEREVIGAGTTRTAPRDARGDRSRSRQMPAPAVHSAMRPPRARRPKQQKVSKKDIANERWSVAQFAEQWWGMESANALLKRSGTALSEDTDGQATFRYGDLMTWVETHHEQFQEWLEQVDPVLKGTAAASPADGNNTSVQDARDVAE